MHIVFSKVDDGVSFVDHFPGVAACLDLLCAPPELVGDVFPGREMLSSVHLQALMYYNAFFSVACGVMYLPLYRWKVWLLDLIPPQHVLNL